MVIDIIIVIVIIIIIIIVIVIVACVNVASLYRFLQGVDSRS